MPRLKHSNKEDAAENAAALGDGGATVQKDPVSPNHKKRGVPPHTHTECSLSPTRTPFGPATDCRELLVTTAGPSLIQVGRAQPLSSA